MDSTCNVCGIMQTPRLPPIQGFETQSVGRNCARCGSYYLMGTAETALPNLIQQHKIDRSVLSHRLRKRYDASGKPIQLFEDDLLVYVGDLQLPRPQEQVDNLVLWMGRSQKTPDQWAQATIPQLAAIMGTSAGTDGRADEPAFNWLLNQIRMSNLFTSETMQNGSALGFRLTFEGWKSFHELNSRVIASRTAFMAMKFNEATLNTVVSECFRPAVINAGFTLRVLNEQQPAGLIDNQIRASIRSARFVIADLSHDNDGAYFEAGFAEGMGLPVIYTCEASKFRTHGTHFDTNHSITIPWSLNSLPDAARQLTATIRATLPGEARFTDN